MDPDQREMLRLAARYGSIGLEIAIAITLGYLVGDYLDERFGTAPYLLLLFLAFGLGAAVKAVLRVIRKVDLDKL